MTYRFLSERQKGISIIILRFPNADEIGGMGEIFFEVWIVLMSTSNHLAPYLMKKQRFRSLDFEIDKLTNSIEDTTTGESLDTEVRLLSFEDRRLLKKLKWAFDWIWELEQPGRNIHALSLKSNSSVWQGLMSSEDLVDHLFMHLLESAPVNKGHAKQYAGVPGNLVAFLCKASFETGYGGNVAFEAKTLLFEHYEKTLGAQRISSSRMLIDTANAAALVKKYFPNYRYDRL